MKTAGYEVGHDPENVERLLARAVAEKNPTICKKLIVPPQIFGGPARYDLVNGCYEGYAMETGDMSICQSLISPGLCVMAIAGRKNNPELCEQAYAPTRNNPDDHRGSCFGYFAERERDYEHCQRLEKLDNMNEHQKIVCMMLYVDSTGDASYCSVHDQPDICYNKAARISSDSSLCNAIKNDEKRKSCIIDSAH